MWHGEFRDARLVPVYDATCGWSRDDDFFVSVVGETAAARVLDLGCGTGRLTLGLAAAGHRVTGVDPAAESLSAARRKPGAERVTWLLGTSEVVPADSFDVAVMTSHVAQFIVTDEQWRGLLQDLARALVPGGRLIFDTRDPAARAWEGWNPVDSRRRVRLPGGREIEHWTAVTGVNEGVVSFVHRYAFSEGEELTATADMRFRSEDELRASLSAAGFRVEAVYGGWNREPVGAGDGELIVVALRR